MSHAQYNPYHWDMVVKHIAFNGLHIELLAPLNHGCGLQIIVTVPPALKERFDSAQDRYAYEQKGPLYFAHDELTGLVSFFAYSEPGRGFGGAKFNIRLNDGTEKVLHGPWSSRCGVMNEVGFTPSTEITLVDKYRMSAAMSIEMLNRLLAGSGYRMSREQKWGECTYHAVPEDREQYAP